MFNISLAIRKIFVLVLLFGFFKLVMIVFLSDGSILQDVRFQLNHRQLFLALIFAPVVETAIVQMLLDFLYKKKVIKKKEIMLFTSAVMFGGIHFDPDALSLVSAISSVASSFCAGLLLQVLYTTARETNAKPFLLTTVAHFSLNLFVVLGILVKSNFNI